MKTFLIKMSGINDHGDIIHEYDQILTSMTDACNMIYTISKVNARFVFDQVKECMGNDYFCISRLEST